MANEELDPRVKKFQTGLKVAGAAAVAVVGSGVVIVGSLSVMAAGALALGALAMVTFVIPVGARSLALARQKALTALAETFSEETIREDEKAEERRVAEARDAYTKTAAALNGTIEALTNQIEHANENERALLEEQIANFKTVIANEFEELRVMEASLTELKRVNPIFIELHRAAEQMKKMKKQVRNPEQLERIITARNAIKSDMRQQIEAQRVRALQQEMRGPQSSIGKQAQIGVSAPVTIQPQVLKETSHVPRDR
jgi:hypothetical protein